MRGKVLAATVAIALSVGAALVPQAAFATADQVCGAFTVRLLSAARRDAVERVERAEIEGRLAAEGFDQTGRLLEVLPATGLPADPALTTFGPAASATPAAAGLDLAFNLTRSGVTMVPDLVVDLSDHYRRILRAPKELGLNGPQCHLPELAFGSRDRARPELHVLREYRTIDQPDCEPLGYLGMWHQSASYDLVETRNEVFVYRDARTDTGNAPTCAFKAVYAPSDVLVGHCNSALCRHVQQVASSAPLPLFVRNTGSTTDLNYGTQIQRALSSDRFAVTFHHSWAVSKLPKPIADLLRSADPLPPISLFEASSTSVTVYMAVYPRFVTEQPQMIARFFTADPVGRATTLDELPIASMTVLGGLLEVTALRRMMFK